MLLAVPSLLHLDLLQCCCQQAATPLCTVAALYSVAGSTHTPTLKPFTVLLSEVLVLLAVLALLHRVTFYNVAVSSYSPRVECGCEQSQSCWLWLSVWTVALFTV